MWTETKRFKVVPAGRRSGKTELAKRRLIMALTEKKTRPGKIDARYFASAPTREQAKRIFWRDLKLMTPPSWIKRIYETDLSITTRFGSELWVVGLDRPQRIEGSPWDGCVLDEFANMRPSAWTENIRPALSDRQGWCWFIGVPEGLNHFKTIADYARGNMDPDWGYYSWHSSDILPPEEIISAKMVLDERTFRQEYEASFEGFTGRVYYAYDAGRHQRECAVDIHLPIVIACDFNVNPCVWELCQTDGEKVWVFDEVVLHNTNTLEMAREFLRRWGSHKGGFVVYGDAAGSHRTTAGKSDYAILSTVGLKKQRIKKANPPVKDRINALNSMLSNSIGKVRLFHSPRCRYLRRDFEIIRWNESSTDMDKRDAETTHATDALGYFIAYEFPLRVMGIDASMRFYK